MEGSRFGEIAKELGIKHTDFELIATNALKDPCSNTNPVKIDMEGMLKILNEAY